MLSNNRGEHSSSRFIKEMNAHMPGGAMCVQISRLRMGHKSACILQPILGQCLEYDGELLRVSFGSVLYTRR